MTFLRGVEGLLSFGAAGLLATHLVTAFHFAPLPILQGLDHEDTYFVILQLGPLSFSGWQIFAVEAIFALLTIALIAAGLYAFTNEISTDT